jgi:hypothetical protein
VVASDIIGYPGCIGSRTLVVGAESYAVNVTFSRKDFCDRIWERLNSYGRVLV